MTAPSPIPRHRVRIRFRKAGDLRLISHRDLVRAMERLFRRAGLKLGMSQGFHPKPRMVFPAALALGVVGDNELLDFELAEPLGAAEIETRLTAHAPAGLDILSVECVPADAKKTRVRAMSFEIAVPAERRAAVAARLADFLSQTTYIAAREDGSHPVDVRPSVEELSLTEDRLRMRLLVNDQGGARPRALLAALGIDDLPQEGIYLTRTQVEFAS